MCAALLSQSAHIGDDDYKRIDINVAYSPKIARTRNSNRKSRSSQCRDDSPSQKSCKIEQKAAETGSDGDDQTDTGRLFQTDAAAAGKVLSSSSMVARRVRGATIADVLDEHIRRRALRSEIPSWMRYNWSRLHRIQSMMMAQNITRLDGNAKKQIERDLDY